MRAVSHGSDDESQHKRRLSFVIKNRSLRFQCASTVHEIQYALHFDIFHELRCTREAMNAHSKTVRLNLSSTYHQFFVIYLIADIM